VSVTHPLPPGCEPACHGCRHRSLDAAASLAQKSTYLARVLAPWGERIAPIEAPEPSRRLGYRDRVTLSARWSEVSGWRFGLMRRDELIAIHDCPVHSARVRALVGLLVERLPPATTLPLAYLHVCGAQATLIVKARNVGTHGLAGLAEGLPVTGLEGCWLHQHPAAGRRLFARSGWQLLWGEPRSRDVHGLLHGTPFENTARAYLENLKVQEAVYRSDADGRRVELERFDPLERPVTAKFPGTTHHVQTKEETS